METRRERFEPGHAPVYPLPERQPWETFQRWGAPPEPAVRPGQYERPWDSPGPPPSWPDETARERSRHGIPTWAVVAIAVGTSLIVISLAALASLPG